jgi:rSAM/selenodomain-associated transferase 1
VVIYGRQPVAGRVKTRLASELGDDLAVEVYGVLLDHTLREVRGSRARVTLSVSDPPDSGWAADLQVPVEVQHGPDLGHRLAATFAARFSEGHSRVVVVGSDCPEIRTRHVERALHLLECVPVVIGPADDGGYWLIGQRSPGADLFSGIPWSTPATLRDTRRRLLEAAIPWRELEWLVDVDTASCLTHVLEARRLPVSLQVLLAGAQRGRRSTE